MQEVKKKGFEAAEVVVEEARLVVLHIETHYQTLFLQRYFGMSLEQCLRRKGYSFGHVVFDEAGSHFRDFQRKERGLCGRFLYLL